MTHLKEIHERLDQHFLRLREVRDADGPGHPIFALEHDLDEDQIVDLKVEVRATLRNGGRGNQWWLPVVIYAAEVGYQYTGDEYWQSFESQSPGWAESGDRPYVRDRFLAFKNRFGGAAPSGVWADQFSIISWPITHAVLPTDLQAHLARLLYDFRHRMTPELLADPAELGTVLASGAWRTSSRFQCFAQNTKLLGQVAAALLLPAGVSSPLLLGSTLSRVVADLSVHRQARAWLSDAKRTAGELDLKKGFKGTGRAREGLPRQGAQQGPIEARLSARRDGVGTWSLFLQLPDLSGLIARIPALEHALGSSRCRVAGVDGPPLARGRLLYGGQTVRLSRWPLPDEPLLRLESSDPAMDSILADECRIPPGSRWLLNISDPDVVRHVRSRAVKAGDPYLLLGSDAVPSAVPWVSPAVVDCEGIRGLLVDVPGSFSAEVIDALGAMDLVATLYVQIRPVGSVAAWDGEGAAEWVSGDRPLLAVSTTRLTDSVILSVDDEPPVQALYPAAERGDPIYFELPDLPIGDHDLKATFAAGGPGPPVIEGHLTVEIREPSYRSPTGTYREPLVLLASPASSDLSDLFRGKTSIEVLGPVGLQLNVVASLIGGANSVLIAKRLQGLTLPVKPSAWARAFDDQFRDARDVRSRYDEAQGCVIEVSHPELGVTQLRCERPFTPLRWGVGSDQRGPFIRLHDNVGSGQLVVQGFEFAAPDIRSPFSIDAERKARAEAGGLFVAQIENYQAGVILPPTIRRLEDLARARVRPRLLPGILGRDLAISRIDQAHSWAEAELPGDPFAGELRNSVIRAFATALCGMSAGDRWGRAELQFEGGGVGAAQRLRDALGAKAWERVEAADLDRAIADYSGVPAEDRVDLFSRVVQRAMPPQQRETVDATWHAGFLLRIASDPGQVRAWGGDRVPEGVDLALRLPAAVRAARYVVLRVASEVGLTGEGAYGGWEWD